MIIKNLINFAKGVTIKNLTTRIMKRLLTFLLLAVTLVCNAQNRIIGGSNATIQERPFQVFVREGNGDDPKYGGGVIIDNEWILTAAHVVDSLKYNPEEFSIYYGNTYWQFCQVAYADTIIVHPEYVYTPGILSEYDIALIKLSIPIPNTPVSSPIQYSRSSAVPQGITGIVSGWGMTGVFSDISNRLKKANVHIEQCTSTTLQARSSQSMAYFGDSGGPLTYSGRLIGIVKGGQGILPTYSPSYYTNVGYFSDWIDRWVVKSVSINAPSLLSYGSTATISWYPSVPFDSYSVSPNLQVVATTENTITVRGIRGGLATIHIIINGHYNTATFNIGNPVISDVYYNNGYLFVNMFGGATTNHTEWIIGGNTYNTYDSFIWCQYSSGIIDVKVRAEVDGTWSNWYETQIDLNNNSFNYSFSITDNTVNILPDEEDEEISLTSTKRDNDENLTYNIINALNQENVMTGQISVYGGSVGISMLNKGNYLFVIKNKKQAKTFKFIR